MTKIEALGLVMLESGYRGERSYAGAYGAMQGMANVMYRRLSESDRQFVDSVIDSVIESELMRRAKEAAAE